MREAALTARRLTDPTAGQQPASQQTLPQTSHRWELSQTRPPQPCGKQPPGTRPPHLRARPRRRQQLPPVCTSPATRGPLATALALPLAAPPRCSRPSPSADWPESEMRVGERTRRVTWVPLAGGDAAGRDTSALLAWAPFSQAAGGDWRVRVGWGGATGACGEPGLLAP